MTFSAENRENVLSWILRAILILLIFFYLLFSLDVFLENHKLGKLIIAFFMHNLFTISLAVCLWIAWKRENLGGILLVILGLFMMYFFGGPIQLSGVTWVLVLIPLLVGILFLVNHYLLQKRE